MAHGLNTTVKRGTSGMVCKSEGKAGIGSRRIFAPQFKLQVLDSYRNDVDCKGNQRATARKYGIHRRQIQKWLQVENNLRNSVMKSRSGEASPEARKCGIELALRKSESSRQRDDVSSEAYSVPQRQVGAEAELEAGSPLRIGGAEARDAVCPDKRVPDIPQQHWCPPERTYESPMISSSVSPHLYSPPAAPAPVTGAQPPCGCPETLPLDFTTHSRRAGSPLGACCPAPPAPIDLSLKKPYPRVGTPAFATPPSPPPPQMLIHTDPPPPVTSPHIWDLSTKGLKRPHDDDAAYTPPYLLSTSCDQPIKLEPPPETKPPVKLFKPYLLDQNDDSSNASSDKSQTYPYTDPVYSLHNRIIFSDPDAYYYNNNNTEYSYYKDETYQTPVLPNSYYYNDYYPNGIHIINYPDDKNPLKKNSNLIKQRQSYSLDFKLSAIQCYYSDAVCKGNQRAVATKYKIHRRQVQKWLKQEDQLRQRVETNKQMHIVR